MTFQQPSTQKKKLKREWAEYYNDSFYVNSTNNNISIPPPTFKYEPTYTFVEKQDNLVIIHNDNFSVNKNIKDSNYSIAQVLSLNFVNQPNSKLTNFTIENFQLNLGVKGIYEFIEVIDSEELEEQRAREEKRKLSLRNKRRITFSHSREKERAGEFSSPFFKDEYIPELKLSTGLSGKYSFSSSGYGVNRSEDKNSNSTGNISLQNIHIHSIIANHKKNLKDFKKKIKKKLLLENFTDIYSEKPFSSRNFLIKKTKIYKNIINQQRNKLNYH